MWKSIARLSVVPRGTIAAARPSVRALASSSTQGQGGAVDVKAPRELYTVPEDTDAPVHTAEETAAVAKAVGRNIKTSPQKLNLVAQMVRGLSVEEAIAQCTLSRKKVAKHVENVLKAVRANAANNHGLNADRLIVKEAFVGKGQFLKRLKYHAKGRHGSMTRPSAHLTVIAEEVPMEEGEKRLGRFGPRNATRAAMKERIADGAAAEGTVTEEKPAQ